MLTDIVEQINCEVSKFTFLDFKIITYDSSTLIIAGSEDFSYFHNIEIFFNDVYSIIGNLEWRVDTKKECITIVDGTEAFDINSRFRVEVGNTIFKFINEYDADCYIIAKELSYKSGIVKY